MNKDTHKGISGIEYNSLNLPRSIAIDNPQDKGRISYTYSAGGVKLRTVHENDMNVQTAAVMSSAPFSSSTTHTTTTDYVGNKVYEDGSLKRILVDGGYISLDNGTYYFYITDHLGNNRTVVKADGNPAQRSHYYPFGMSYAEGTGQDSQPYKYNGKELDRRLGLNMYDYSARYYEPAIGRFTTVDPHAENYYSISPYAYVMNNPLKFIDPTGKDAVITIKDSTITVNVSIILYGKDATNQAVSNIKNDIVRNWYRQTDGSNWTYTDPATKKNYTVVFDVSVSLLNGKEKQRPNVILDSWNPFSSNNYIEIDNSVARDYVLAGDEGVWAGNRRQVPSHEFGHLVGLKDRYSEYRGRTSVDSGWEGNMMADNIAVDQRNINGIVSEAVTSYNIMKQTTAISSRYPRVPGRKKMPSIFTYQINSIIPSK